MPPPPLTSLKSDPEVELEFPSKVDPNNKVTRTLTLTNTTNGFVGFKVKTTAPKDYLVRPSSGVVPAGQSEEVKIFLNISDPSVELATAQLNHRFLVQAVDRRDGNPMQKEDWNVVPKESIQELRLNVIFTAGSGTTGAPPASIGTGGSAQFQSMAPSKVGAGGDQAELQQRYQQLVNYVMRLETQEKGLKHQVEELERQKAQLAGGGKGGSAAAGKGADGYPLWQLLVLAIIAFVMGMFVPVGGG